MGVSKMKRGEAGDDEVRKTTLMSEKGKTYRLVVRIIVDVDGKNWYCKDHPSLQHKTLPEGAKCVRRLKWH